MNGVNGASHIQQTLIGESGTHRPTGNVTAGKLRRLLEWQQYRCALTGRRLKPASTNADHIIPHSKGGETIMENVQLIHQDVNKAKGTMSQEAFVRMCCEVAEHYGTPHKRVPV